MNYVQASLAPGPIGKSEHTNEELVNILKAKGCILSARLEAALMLIPRDLFVPRDRHRCACGVCACQCVCVCVNVCVCAPCGFGVLSGPWGQKGVFWLLGRVFLGVGLESYSS